MIQLIKKLLDKLEPPANDWVLSRYGGQDDDQEAADASAEPNGAEDEPPVSAVARVGTKRNFKSWFAEQEALLDEQEALERSPESGEVSSNASTDFSDTNIAVTPIARRQSRVS